MSSVLSPLPPTGPVAALRDPSGHAPSSGLRPVAAATAIDSARAPRPVDPGSAGFALRNDEARDRPVGPPPSFDVNVLQDIRARMRDAPPEAEVPSPQGETARAAVATAEIWTGDDTHPPSPESPHLDRKV